MVHIITNPPFHCLVVAVHYPPIYKYIHDTQFSCRTLQTRHSLLLMSLCLLMIRSSLFNSLLLVACMFILLCCSCVPSGNEKQRHLALLLSPLHRYMYMVMAWGLCLVTHRCLRRCFDSLNKIFN